MIYTSELFGKRYRITRSEKQYTVEKSYKNKKEGGYYWSPDGYYSSLRGALNALLEKKMYEKDKIVDLKDYLLEYKREVRKFRELLKELQEEV